MDRGLRILVDMLVKTLRWARYSNRILKQMAQWGTTAIQRNRMERYLKNIKQKEKTIMELQVEFMEEGDDLE